MLAEPAAAATAMQDLQVPRYLPAPPRK